ncbi:MAG: hypothetical protein H6636_12370 [Anaerolineales bacterium]|nr:hypothetical protein [Anaerolineales bacterium]
MQAQTIDEIYRTVNPDQPVTPDHDYYVNLNPARGDKKGLAALIARRVQLTSPSFHRHLVTGHLGSGKSTELSSLRLKLEAENYLVIFLDIEESLGIGDVTFVDLMVAIIKAVEETARDKKLKIDKALLDNIGKWFAETFIVTEEGESVEHRLDTSIGVDLPLLLRAVLLVTGQVKSASATRTETRRRLENRLDDLMQRVGELVNDLTVRAKNKQYTGVVIIVDSLEKIFLRVINETTTNHSLLFVNHAEQLKALPCHTIYTVPVSLLSERNLEDSFNDFDLIPMVTIKTSEDQPAPGRDLLYQVVEKRLNIPNLFERPELVYRLVEASGGVVRDLMRLLLFAADYTPDDGKIGEGAVQEAIRKLTREYDRQIHRDDLELLAEVARNRHVSMTKELARLMYNKLVLRYINGDDWLALHPAVQQAPTFRAYVQQKLQP